MKKLCTLLFIAGVTSNLLSAADQGKELARSGSNSSLGGWENDSFGDDTLPSRSNSPVQEGSAFGLASWFGTCRTAASALGSSVIAPFSAHTAPQEDEIRTFSTSRSLRFNPDGSVTERFSREEETLCIPVSIPENTAPGVLTQLAASVRGSNAWNMAERRTYNYVLNPLARFGATVGANALDTFAGASDTCRRYVAGLLVSAAQSIAPANHHSVTIVAHTQPEASSSSHNQSSTAGSGNSSQSE